MKPILSTTELLRSADVALRNLSYDNHREAQAKWIIDGLAQRLRQMESEIVPLLREASERISPDDLLAGRIDDAIQSML